MKKYIKIGIFLMFFIINQVGYEYHISWLSSIGAILMGGWLVFNLK